MDNKDVALDFLRLIIAGRVNLAYTKHVGEGFRHHNPYFPGDADALREGMQDSENENPGKLFEVKHAIAEGDLVAVHSHLRMHADDIGMATVPLFRLHEGKIVELWDRWMPIPADSPNQFGMF